MPALPVPVSGRDREARYDVVLSIGDCSFKELVNEYVCFNTRSGPGMIRIFFAFHEERQKVSSLFIAPIFSQNVQSTQAVPAPDRLQYRSGQ